jgi:3-oxoacyl-[acyl-carrier-protein] synthase III
MSLLVLFVEVDDFHQVFEAQLAKQHLSSRKYGPAASRSNSEIMTIVIHFHQIGYRDFKHYYLNHVCKHLRAEFPALVSVVRCTGNICAGTLPFALHEVVKSQRLRRGDIAVVTAVGAGLPWGRLRCVTDT